MVGGLGRGSADTSEGIRAVYQQQAVSGVQLFIDVFPPPRASQLGSRAPPFSNRGSWNGSLTQPDLLMPELDILMLLKCS